MAKDTFEKIKLGFATIGVKAGSTREKQKLKTKALTTEKEISKMLQTLGEAVYDMWMNNEADLTKLEEKVEKIREKKIEVEDLIDQVAQIDERDRQRIEEKEKKIYEEQARRQKENMEKKAQKQEAKRQKAEERQKEAERKEESERINQPPPDVIVTPPPPQRKAIAQPNESINEGANDLNVDAMPSDAKADLQERENNLPNVPAGNKTDSLSNGAQPMMEEESLSPLSVKAGAEKNVEQTPRICPNCGSEFDIPVKFCGECGTKMP